MHQYASQYVCMVKRVGYPLLISNSPFSIKSAVLFCSGKGIFSFTVKCFEKNGFIFLFLFESCTFVCPSIATKVMDGYNA